MTSFRCPHCNEMYDDANESQPCCGMCGHPISCGCFENRNANEPSNAEDIQRPSARTDSLADTIPREPLYATQREPKSADADTIRASISGLDEKNIGRVLHSCLTLVICTVKGFNCCENWHAIATIEALNRLLWYYVLRSNSQSSALLQEIRMRMVKQYGEITDEDATFYIGSRWKYLSRDGRRAVEDVFDTFDSSHLADEVTNELVRSMEQKSAVEANFSAGQTKYFWSWAAALEKKHYSCEEIAIGIAVGISFIAKYFYFVLESLMAQLKLGELEDAEMAKWYLPGCQELMNLLDVSVVEKMDGIIGVEI